MTSPSRLPCAHDDGFDPSLTPAQLEALRTLGRCEDKGRTPVEGWKRSTNDRNVNSAAALSLSRLGLVGWDVGFSARYRFYLTTAGRKRYEAGESPA